MFKKILVCCDGSKHGKCAADFAIHLAAEEHADLELLSIVEPLPSYVASPKEIEEECAFDSECLKHKQQEFMEHASKLGVKIDTKIMQGKASELIVKEAEEFHCDLIILGRHTGHQMWVHQSAHTAEKIIETAPCAVLIAN